METFKITFYKEREDKENFEETIELMAQNDIEAANIFKLAEPFATIIEIKQI